MKPTRPIALTALCAILLAGPMAASASAADPVTDQEAIAAVERAAPPAGVIVPAPAAAGQLKAAAGDGGAVTIPVDPAGTVAVNAANGQPAVRLGLPDRPSQGDAAVAADGTVTYDDPTGQAGLAVQALPDGVRVQTVIAGPGAPTEYAYPLTLPPGGTLQPSGDGGFLILDAAGAPTAQILAPWAKDAAGNQVSTRYQQRGTTIVQIVDHRQPGTAYPVVDTTQGARLRSRAAELVPLLFSNPSLTTARAEQALGVANQGARKLLAQAEQPGWIEQVGTVGKAGRIVWVARDVLDIMEAPPAYAHLNVGPARQ